MKVSHCPDICRHAFAFDYRNVTLSFTRSKLFGVWLLSCLLLTGCGAEKESLFEEEHDPPAHWPSSLTDAADNIEHRLSRLESVRSESNHETGRAGPAQFESELRDLVEWIPEVAADTDLREEHWLPIYEMCEVMREHMSRGDVSALEIEEDFRKLQSLLVDSAQLIPISANSLVEGNSESDALDSSEQVGGEALEPQGSLGAES